MSVETREDGLTKKERTRNERALLSSLRADGPQSSAQLARRINVSAQTASVLTRGLETEGFLSKGKPVKGGVGKPHVPVHLNPDASFAFGLRIGRRGADLVLLDLVGQVRMRATTQFPYPTPALIETFIATQLDRTKATLNSAQFDRIEGIGIAAPFELWNWSESLNAPRDEAERWRGYDFIESFSRFTTLPVIIANDINMACSGELIYGAGADLPDFGYFYVGAFVGGGIAMNGRVYHGSRRNAGALGSIPVGPRADIKHQLMHHASIYRLEDAIRAEIKAGVDLREDSAVWRTHAHLVEPWLEDTAENLAKAATAVCAVLDLPVVLVDGSLPTDIRARLVALMNDAIPKFDQRGLNPFVAKEGVLGREAAALGAAQEPLVRAHFEIG